MKRISRLWGLALAVILLLQVFGGTAVFAREEAGPEDFIRRIGKETILAALYEADIPSLRKAIDLGLVSCVELTQYYLDRIDAYNDDYNCFITMCDNALEKARACDRQLAEGTTTSTMKATPPPTAIPSVTLPFPPATHKSWNTYWLKAASCWQSPI